MVSVFSTIASAGWTGSPGTASATHLKTAAETLPVLLGTARNRLVGDDSVS